VIQRFNYTGREKIVRKNLSITIKRENDKITSFVLDRLDLQGLNLPPDADTWIEAYYRSELKRFDCGTVTNLKLPLVGELSDMAYTENLKFRILIAERQNRKILAHADRLAPEEPAGKEFILPVDFGGDLGNMIWTVKYEGDDGGPVLFINRKIPNIENIAKHDPMFFVYVYPVVIREILTYMIFVEGVDSVSDPSSEWHKKWLKFSCILGITPPQVLNPEHDNFDKDAASNWIDAVARAFCDKYVSKFNELINQLEKTP